MSEEQQSRLQAVTEEAEIDRTPLHLHSVNTSGEVGGVQLKQSKFKGSKDKAMMIYSHGIKRGLRSPKDSVNLYAGINIGSPRERYSPESSGQAKMFQTMSSTKAENLLQAKQLKQAVEREEQLIQNRVMMLQ